ncbi:LysR family transcriptional regulator [Methylobacterium nonmethylotrophicum]|uniref:LysR family transcriptional regulator n=1 Tax=Methylobacterium nonmethylotrophicum TaxID=1141884 RepID=UPI001FE1680D|nr:LysR family transcriptional regulator [Methylobacterium nonmethylotrophicum]
MNWDAFDFKLLIVFDAIMRERHVTRAGERLGLSQSAVSHALQRLRRALGDELFVRGPEGMSPTPRALTLAEPVRRALAEIEGVLHQDQFDPASSTASFRLVVNNTAAVVLAAPIAAWIGRRAPALHLHMSPSGTVRVDDLLDRGDVDLAIVGSGRVEGERFGTTTLVRDGFAVVGRRGHPALDAPLTYERLAGLPHLVVSSTGDDVGFIDAILSRRGLSPRRIAMSAPFLSAAPILAASDMVAVLGERIARTLATVHPVACAPLPADPDLPVTRSVLVWARRVERHPGHAWLRRQIADCVRSLPGGR